MIKKKTSSQVKAEDKWLQSLPTIPRVIMGGLRYNLREILLVLCVVFLGLWLLTSFGYIGKYIKIVPGVNIQHKTK